MLKINKTKKPKKSKTTCNHIVLNIFVIVWLLANLHRLCKTQKQRDFLLGNFSA